MATCLLRPSPLPTCENAHRLAVEGPDRTGSTSRTSLNAPADANFLQFDRDLLFAHADKGHNWGPIGNPDQQCLEAHALLTMDENPLDPDLTFAKTPAGEEAMQQRTRVVQRNLRMVLILVDGNATVSELCNRTGNPQLTQNALRELENDGFIERRADKESVWVEGGKYSRKAKAVAEQPPSEFSTYGSTDASIVVPEPTAPRDGRPIPSPPRNRDNQSTLPPPTPSLAGADSGTVFLPRTDPWPDFGSSPAQSQSQKPSLLARLRALLAEDDTEAPADLKPIKRGGRLQTLSWPLRVALGTVVLMLITVLVTLLFPYALYLPEVQAALAQSTEEPATIADMRVSFYPKPGLLLTGVALGRENDGKAIQIAEVRLQPRFSTLFSSRMVFREVELSGLELSAESITKLSHALKAAARQSARAGVVRVTLDKARIAFAGFGVDAMKGEFVLSADQQTLQSASLHSLDRNLQVEAQPIAGGLAVQLEALGWRPAAQAPYVIDSLTVKGEVLGKAFVVDHLELRIFGGMVQGTAILRAENQAVASGGLAFKRIDVKRLGEALGIGGQFEGDASGRMNFSTTSANWDTILPALSADGEFALARGSLGGIDLPEAVRRASTTPSTLGGATRFEQLTGTFKVSANGVRFSRLALSAGLMQSTGDVEINRELQIRGRMDVQMRGRADHSAKSVAINGPLRAPQVQAP